MQLCKMPAQVKFEFAGISTLENELITGDAAQPEA